MLWWTLRQLKSKNRKTRMKAIEDLGKLKDPRVVEPLVKVLRDKGESSGTKEEIAKILGESRDPRAVEPLLATVKDKSRKVRRMVVCALEKIGDARAIEPLLERLTDEAPEVQEAASEVLKEIDPKWMESEQARAAIPALIPALKRSETMGTISRILGEIDSSWRELKEVQALVPSLIAKLKSGNKSEQKAVVEVLGEINDPRAIAPLTEALRNLLHLKEEESGQQVAYELRVALLRNLRHMTRTWGKSEAAHAIVPILVDIMKICASAARGTLHWEMQIMEILGNIDDSRAIEPILLLIPYSERMGERAPRFLEKIDPNWMKSEEALAAVRTLVLWAATGGEIAGGAKKTLRKIDPNWMKSEAALPAIKLILEWLLNSGRDKEKVTQAIIIVRHLLKSNASSLPEEDLRELAALDNVVCNATAKSGKKLSRTIDCSDLKQLARQELIRRRLNA